MNDEEITDLIEELIYSYQSDKYEPGGFFTVGGNVPLLPAQNIYMIQSPWNTECEYCVYTLVSNINRCIAVVGASPAINIPDTTGGVAYGLASAGKDNNALPYFICEQGANGGQSFVPIWLPVSAGTNVYVAMGSNVAGTGAFLTVAFRRSYAHIIPDVPRQRAGTHSFVQSRRRIRTIPGFSKQESGYAAQYPERRNRREFYQHSDIPYQEDVENLNPLTSRSLGQRGRGNR